MDRPIAQVADLSQIEPRLAWSLGLYESGVELTRESLADRVCQLVGIPPGLSEEEIDVVIVCALVAQRCLISTGAPPYWESAELGDFAAGLVSQRVPVEVGRRLARRMLDAGRLDPQAFHGDFWLGIAGLIGAAFIRPLEAAGFAKVWATNRVPREPTPPRL